MSYEERRVRVRIYGTLPRDSSLLVPVPGVWGKPRRLHRLAAEALAKLAEAVERDVGVGLQLASGWRKHKWESRKQYEQYVIAKYGSVREGGKWLAYDSPHETGLAMDIGTGGLWPTKSTRDAQRKTALHRWLVENAHAYGWHPYKVEPWHWEYPLSIVAYQSGVIAEDDPGPPEDDVSFAIDGEEPDVIEDVEGEELWEEDD